MQKNAGMSQSDNIIVSLRNVRKVYRQWKKENVILDDVSFDIPKGSIFGFL